MTLTFSYADGAPLVLETGLTADAEISRLNFGTSYFFCGPFGKIIVQEVRFKHCMLRAVTVNWSSTRRLRCHSQDKGILLRVIETGECRTEVKGAGEIHLMQSQATVLAVNQWTETLDAGNIQISFMELIWSPEFFQLYFPKHEWIQAYARVHHRVPDVLVEPPLGYTNELQQMLDGLQNELKWDGVHPDKLPSALTSLAERVPNLVADFVSRNQEIRQHDVQLIVEARNIIAGSLDRHWTIPEISQLIGINEFKLKKFFPLLFGRTPFDYRMYLLCLRARDEILSSNAPIKSFHQRAGYKRTTAFTTAFRKHLCCTPGELTRNEWSKDEFR